jgi:hypothetical protein
MQKNTYLRFVYFIHEENNFTIFKIGKTALHPADRCEQLQTGNPRKLIIYRWIEVPDHSTLEESLHAQFKHAHIRGEWFHVDRDEIDIACAQVLSLDTAAIVSADYPTWTEEDLISVQERRVAAGVYKGGKSPRTARRKKKEFWAAKNQPSGFSDD